MTVDQMAIRVTVDDKPYLALCPTRTQGICPMSILSTSTLSTYPLVTQSTYYLPILMSPNTLLHTHTYLPIFCSKREKRRDMGEA